MNLYSEVSTAFPRETPVARYLATRFTYFDYDKWLVRMAEGRIQRNGFPALAGDTVSPGDIVSYDAGEFEEPAADLSYRITWEDSWFLCIDKPGNLLVHRAGISFHNNLMHQLRHVHSPAFPSAHPVHRLDRETSGALMVGKTREANRAWPGVRCREGRKMLLCHRSWNCPERDHRAFDRKIGEFVDSV